MLGADYWCSPFHAQYSKLKHIGILRCDSECYHNYATLTTVSLSRLFDFWILSVKIQRSELYKKKQFSAWKSVQPSEKTLCKNPFGSWRLQFRKVLRENVMAGLDEWRKELSFQSESPNRPSVDSVISLESIYGIVNHSTMGFLFSKNCVVKISTSNLRKWTFKSMISGPPIIYHAWTDLTWTAADTSQRHPSNFV